MGSPDAGEVMPPELDHAAVDRGIEALSRFVFPGRVVPRREMAVAVIRASSGAEGWREYLPPKRIVEAMTR